MRKFVKDIAIYGAGGFGREVACMINHINTIKHKWNLIGFFDDNFFHKNRIIKYGQIIGGIEDLNKYLKRLSIIIAIANPCDIKKISEKINNPFIDFPNIIAPNVLFFDQETLNIGKGNIIFFGCRISCNVTIGNFNILNGLVSLGHDVVIGNYNVLQPSVRISGNTIVGDNNFFGVQSIVLQNLKIGNNTKIGAGAVVINNTKNDNLYFGNPAKIVKIR